MAVCKLKKHNKYTVITLRVFRKTYIQQCKNIGYGITLTWLWRGMNVKDVM